MASSGWSSVEFFRVGRLNATADWTGQWIAQPGAAVPDPSNPCSFYGDIPNSLFRRSFEVPTTSNTGSDGERTGDGDAAASIEEIVLHITGLGYVLLAPWHHQLMLIAVPWCHRAFHVWRVCVCVCVCAARRYYTAYINGQRVGAAPALDPGFTSYDKRVLYSTYDVTELVHATTREPNVVSAASSANNVIAVALGNGWWNPLPLLFWGHLNLREHLTVGTQTMLKLDLVATYSDGTSRTLVSSLPGVAGGWKTAGGPLLHNDIYLGVKYDARVDAELAGEYVCLFRWLRGIC